MSITFLVMFFILLKSPDVDTITTEYFYCWALFAIADALWLRALGGGK